MHPFKSIAWTRISEWVILLPQNPLKTFAGDDWLLYISLHLSVLELYYSKGIINTSDRIIVSFFFSHCKVSPIFFRSPCKLSYAVLDKFTRGHQCILGPSHQTTSPPLLPVPASPGEAQPSGPRHSCSDLREPQWHCGSKSLWQSSGETVQ